MAVGAAPPGGGEGLAVFLYAGGDAQPGGVSGRAVIWELERGGRRDAGWIAGGCAGGVGAGRAVYVCAGGRAGWSLATRGGRTPAAEGLWPKRSPYTSSN